MITKQQYRKLMSEYQETRNLTQSAMKAGMSRQIARKYLNECKPPAELQAKHTWRTREDPLAGIWPQACAMLEEAPDLEAKMLFEHLLERSPEAAQEQHLRTFQRRVKLWRLAQGPDKEVFFPQDWEPGRVMELDWTNCNELAITIAGHPYDHLLCHCVLAHSNWDWATPCLSESLLSCRQGLQNALYRLGKVPRELRVDNSSAATHRVGAGGTGREFNEQFESLCKHYGIDPHTTGIECPNENGDVESSNGHLKRRLRQHLLVRGSRDFHSEPDYERFLHDVLERGNRHRQEKLRAELAVMKPLPATRLSEYDEVICRVSSGSTIRVKKVGYSVPARLIGHEVRVEVYERELKLYSGRQLLLVLHRHCGDRGVVLNYRHVIDHLLRKPGAFDRYRYREQLYPSRSFRDAHDRLVARHGQHGGTVEYLRLLKLASEAGESDVEILLADYLSPPFPEWSVEGFRRILQPEPKPQVDEIKLQPEWHSYDALLSPELEVTYVS
jgi:hypothetical protein